MRTARTCWPVGTLAAVVLGLLVLPPAGALGDDADDIVRQIVRRTPDRGEAARKILAAARSLTDSPAIQIRLCEKAYEHGMGAPSGYPSAIAALDLLETVAPTRVASWREKRLEVYRLQYYRSTRQTKADKGLLYVKLLLSRARAGGKDDNWRSAANYYRQAYQVARTLKLPEKDAIYEDLRMAGSYEMIHNRIETLRTALGRNPDDQFSRKQMMMAYLVDLDKPEEAVKYLNDKIDPTLHANVTKAAKEAADLTDADLFALATWYRTLGAKAPLKHTKVRMLTRALDNLQLYLEVYTRQDAQRLRATTLLKLLMAELKALGAEVAVRPSLPAGVILVFSFNKGQWIRDKAGRVHVRDVSGRQRQVPLVGRSRSVTPGVPGKVDTGIALARGSRSGFGIPAKATTGLKTFTFAFWIKTAETGRGRMFWTNPTLLGYRTDGYASRDFGITSYRGVIGYWSGLGARRDYSYQSKSVRIGDGAWHHIALTNDGKTMLLYVDGKCVSSAGLPAGQPLLAIPIPLGASAYLRGDRYGSLSHSGTYDELQIYDRGLTAEQVAALVRGPGR